MAHRWMGYQPETEPLYQETNLRREQETKKWDVFRDPPKKVATGSMVEHRYVNLGEKIAKVSAYVITFIVVLGCAALSKGTFLFMTSQISDTVTRPVCEGPDGPYDRYTVTLGPREKIAWMWIILFTFFVPQLATLFRSVRIIAFKSWKKPTVLDFLSIFITESLPTMGLALLAFKILPSLDVVRAAMLTNSVCLVPAVLNLISRYRTVIDDDDKKTKDPNVFMKIVLDVVSIIGQASALIVWPVIYSDRVESWSNIYLIPLSVFLISFGWWENYVSDDSNLAFIRVLAESKKKFENSRYYVYIFVSIWKCALFFGFMFISPPEGVGRYEIFDDFVSAFTDHHLVRYPVENQNKSTVIMETYGEVVDIIGLAPVWVFLINIAATYVCYAFGKFACKIYIQGFSYAFPINLAVPVTVTVLIAMCGEYVRDPCVYFDHIPIYLFYNVPEVNYLGNFLSQDHVWVWLLWLLSQAWITAHIWSPTCEKLASTERLYVRPMFDPFLIDQDIALNRRRNDKPIKVEEEELNADDFHFVDDSSQLDQKTVDDSDSTTRIYACGTMWHETREEMMEFLKSIMRLDEDQSARRIVKEFLKLDIPDYYEFETHVFFDDAFVRVSQDDPDPQINQWVKEMVQAVDDAASEVHETVIRVRPPKKYLTPYGGRLVWTLPGKSKMIAHLKDKKKIRAKKRWSQVMYMYYLLGHKLMELDISVARKELRAENTYILALDGDIDFQPKAVHLLVDLMKKNKSLGAACGRIHPLGSGPMVWYQMFEYSIGHWLQKATEHVIGCVLCSPGCFSLFRGKALMDDSVMRKYALKSSEARHYVQYDQGEDRWLCTLLLQRGYRVEYSAASDSYTHCPEGFNEFYNQRRRWMPSTTANILDLLAASKQTIKVNDNISFGYILYQGVLMVGTVLGPGTIFLMLVGAFVAAFQLDQWSSFIWNVVPILFFVLVCTFFSNDKIQLFVAGILSGVYGLIMMAVLVGVALQISSDGFLAPSSLFFFCVAAQLILTAFLHPKELNCLKYGLVYYVTIPSMYMLLVIYSVFNMNNVSWGTREVTVVQQAAAPAAGAEEKAEDAKAKKETKSKSRVFRFLGGKEEDNTGSLTCSVASLFKCMCCTHKDDKEETQLQQIDSKIEGLIKKLEAIERGEILELEPRKSQMPRMSQMPRNSQMPRTSQMPRSNQMPRASRRMTTTLLTGLAMQPALDGSNSDTQSISETAVSEEVAANTWLDDPVLQRGEVDFIDSDEYIFFNGLLDKYLYPIDDTENKTRIQQELKDLRDKVVLAFFMINALFILVVFLLTLKKDDLHIKWPLEVKINFTYVDDLQEILIYKEYLQLEPIGIVFLFGFAALLVVQFCAMLIHRFQTLSQILSNTVLNLSCFNTSSKNLTDDEILEMDAVAASKQLQKLKGVDSDDEERVEAEPGRRKTIHHLAMKGRKNLQATTDLEKAFQRRWGKIRTGGQYKGPIPRQTLRALDARMSRVERQPGITLRRPTIGGGGGGGGGHANSAFEMDV